VTSTSVSIVIYSWPGHKLYRVYSLFISKNMIYATGRLCKYTIDVCAYFYTYLHADKSITTWRWLI